MCRIVVVGTGAAGAAAAHQLSQSKLYEGRDLEIVVVEADSLLGGRTRCVSVDGHPVDLGASWIEDSGPHSVTGEENPMLELAKRYGVATYVPNSRHDSFILSHDGNRNPPEAGTAARLHSIAMGHVHKTKQRLASHPSQPDVSVLHAYEAGLKKAKPPREAPWIDYFASAHEQFYGDSMAALSCRYYGTGGSYTGGDQWVHGGYGTVVARHWKAIRERGACAIRLNTTVAGISKNGSNCGGAVRLTLGDGSVLDADFVVFTGSLGVLKAGAVQFSPELPAVVRQSIADMGWGLMDKVVFAFEAPFWGANASGFTVAGAARGHWRSWFVTHGEEDGAFVLMCIVAADAAKVLQVQSDGEVKAEGLSVLQAAFRLEARPEPTFFAYSRWGCHPSIRGGYSSLVTSASPVTIAGFQTPCYDGRLLLAGEHTDPADYCSVHGAYNSGIRAAKQVLAQLPAR